MTAEAPALDQTTTLRLLSQQAIDESQVRTVRYYEQVARAAAAKAELELTLAQAQANIPEINVAAAEAMLRRAKNACRPCVFWGAKLEDGGEHWVARYGELAVRGETAEMAMDNFDRAWTLGDRHYLVETDGDDDPIATR